MYSNFFWVIKQSPEDRSSCLVFFWKLAEILERFFGDSLESHVYSVFFMGDSNDALLGVGVELSWNYRLVCFFPFKGMLPRLKLILISRD